MNAAQTVLALAGVACPLGWAQVIAVTFGEPIRADDLRRASEAQMEPGLGLVGENGAPLALLGGGAAPLDLRQQVEREWVVSTVRSRAIWELLGGESADNLDLIVPRDAAYDRLVGELVSAAHVSPDNVSGAASEEVQAFVHAVLCDNRILLLGLENTRVIAPEWQGPIREMSGRIRDFDSMRRGVMEILFHHRSVRGEDLEREGLGRAASESERREMVSTQGSAESAP